MDLSEYLKDKSQTAFAAQLGVSQGLVWQWLRGRTRVTAEKASEIERLTGGVVTRRDLRPDDWWLVWPELATDPRPSPATPSLNKQQDRGANAKSRDDIAVDASSVASTNAVTPSGATGSPSEVAA